MKTTVIAQYHPAAALHNPRLWATMLDDWENLPEVVPHDYLITPVEQFKDVKMFALDTETDGKGGIGQWSIAYRDKNQRLCVTPFYGRQDINFGEPICVMHNAKYDLRELTKNGMRVPKNYYDTMIMAYCMGLGKQAPKEDSKKRSGSDMVGGLGLKYLGRRHLGMQMMTWEQVKDNPDKVPEYNADDSVATLLLAEKWLPQVGKFFFDIDMPLLEVLMKIEDRGVQIDPDYLTIYAKELDNRLANFDDMVQHLAFHTQDLVSYIYGTLEIEPWKFTDGGAPSVEAEVIETIHDPVVDQIKQYKELYKDRGTYVEHYVRLRDIDDRIHPELKQTSTSTSRLSCARPNLQNLDKEGNMRKLIVAPEGSLLVRADWNQLDFRALACITKDQILIDALNANKKIHQLTAELMNMTYDDAKTLNFGVMFGQEAWAIAGQYHVTIDKARQFLADYFKKYPGIKRYRDEMTETLKATKKATIPLTGRTRRIDAMYVEQYRIQQEGIKEGINLPVQGTEAEVVKIAMNELHYKHHAPIILQVHDELLFEVPEKDAVEYAHWLRDYIPTIIEINGVKFPVEVSIGKNWYETGLKEKKI